jgi:hypothetical protein
MLGFPEFNLAAFLAMVISGVATFLWLRTMVSRKAALGAAVLYMVMPYHLWADLYVRGAFPEFWAMAWTPLVLYFTSRLVQEKRGFAGLGVSYALLLTSHLFSLLLVSLVPVGMAAALSRPERRARITLTVLAAMALGAALSAVYLLPALALEHLIPASRVTADPHYFYANNFLNLRWSLFWGGPGQRFHWYISAIALSMFVLVICAAAVALEKMPPRRRRPLYFWLAVCAVSLFLMLSASRPVWEMLPMLQKVQFPWRLQVVLSAAAAAVLALALEKVSRPFTVRSASATVIACLIVFSWGAWFLRAWRAYQGNHVDPNQTAVVRLRIDGLTWVWARWSDPGLMQRIGELSRSTARARLQSEGTVSAAVWQARSIRLQTDTPQETWMLVGQFYFPGWEATELQSGAPLRLDPSPRDGLLRIWTPAGRHEIQLRFRRGRAERVGWLVTLGALVLCASAASIGSIRARRRRVAEGTNLRAGASA